MTESISKTIDDGGPAFSRVEPAENGYPPVVYAGMSVRVWLAGLAMQQLIYRREMSESETYTKDELAAESFHYADAMIRVMVIHD